MIKGDVRVKVIFNDFDKITHAMLAEAERIVAKAAFDIAAGAQHNIVLHGLVDTGALLDSVQAKRIGRMTWVVIVGAEYGIYHELGTRFLPARAFLGPAADQVRPLFLIAMRALIR